MRLYTEFGYPLDEIASALQKTIRRGEEEQALWFAHELEPKFHQYLWRRLCVIACEDIGPANPNTLCIVNAARESYYFHRNTNTRGTSDPNYLTHAVVTLCRSPKTREANDLQAMVLAEREDQADTLSGKIGPSFTAATAAIRNAHPIPDYALDLHTRRGRQLRRGLDFWFEEASRVVPDCGNRYLGRFRAFIYDRFRREKKPLGRGLSLRINEDQEV